MPVTTTTYSKVLFLGEQHKILNTEDGLGNKSILWGVLDRFAPVFERQICVDLEQSIFENLN